ncbi:MAG TPA: hypothetical protein VG755_08000 [Nannocystaceae bacterium]|nr:hypothetical protein [Nannocystaceae bacterium]
MPGLIARGGGPRSLEVRDLGEGMLVVHVYIDCKDAMGANLANSVAEALGTEVARLAGGRLGLRILSNRCDRRLVRVSAWATARDLRGRAEDGLDASGPADDVIDGIVAASRFAERDPYRAATHNKGIMNGVDAVVLATGNDWRAMEASAHAYASLSGRYGPLATWKVGAGGWLEGTMSLPAAVGVVGGATQAHPVAKLALEILGNPSAAFLGQVMAAAGLASNLAALKAMATEGIQRGHMSLHARSVALTAGAVGAEVEQLALRLIEVGEIKAERAAALLLQLRNESRS